MPLTEITLLRHCGTNYIKISDLMDYLTTNIEWLEEQVPLKATVLERQKLRNGAEYVRAIRNDLALSVAKAK